MTQFATNIKFYTYSSLVRNSVLVLIFIGRIVQLEGTVIKFAKILWPRKSHAGIVGKLCIYDSVITYRINWNVCQ